MCGAIGLEAASNPSDPLLAGTLGYTMWWGSELGFFVWLGARVGAVARALARRCARAFAALSRSTRGASRRAPAPTSLAAASVACLGATVGVGAAVASTAHRDSHAYEYHPTRVLAAAIERAVPSGTTIDYSFDPLPPGTQPIEPAVRFFLVRHGDRVLARGSYRRLGPITSSTTAHTAGRCCSSTATGDPADDARRACACHRRLGDPDPQRVGAPGTSGAAHSDAQTLVGGQPESSTVSPRSAAA